MSPSFAQLEFSDYPRADLRRHLQLNTKVPSHALDEVVDLACHGAASGRLALLETIDRGSNPAVSTTAIGIALSLLQADIEQILLGLKGYAAATGKSIYDGPLKVEADG